MTLCAEILSNDRECSGAVCVINCVKVDDEREAMDVGITTKNSSTKFKHRYFCQSH